MASAETQPATFDLSRQSSPIVLGATSLVGEFLLNRLVDAGVEVIGLSRVPQALRPGVTWLTGDLRTLDLPDERQARSAFSLSPIWHLPASLPALHRYGVIRLVAFSSTSLFTKADSPVASERYVARLLMKGEAQTQAFCQEHGITWTILRPTVIYAEGKDRSITRLAGLIRRVRWMPLAGDAVGRRQPVHADDLAAGAIAAAASPATANRAYEVPGGETLTYRAMIERIFEGMGRSPRIVSVPPPIWRLGISLASARMSGVTTEMGSRMSQDLVFDSSAAERDFDWRPRGFRPQFLEG